MEIPTDCYTILILLFSFLVFYYKLLLKTEKFVEQRRDLFTKKRKFVIYTIAVITVIILATLVTKFDTIPRWKNRQKVVILDSEIIWVLSTLTPTPEPADCIQTCQ